jgi:hypothetical protein
MTKIAGSNPAQGFSINIPSMIATKFFGYQSTSIAFLYFYYLVFPYSPWPYNILKIGLLVKYPASGLENNFLNCHNNAQMLSKKQI